MIHHTCYKCHHHLELDPIVVGAEIIRLNKKNPTHYQAVCPGCGAVNKVSIKEMASELKSVTAESEKLAAEMTQARQANKPKVTAKSAKKPA